MPIAADKTLTAAQVERISRFTEQQNRLYQYAIKYGSITTRQAETLLGLKQRRTREILKEMVGMGALEKSGAYRSTIFLISSLIAIYHILKDGVVFKDLGADYYNKFNKERKISAYFKKLKVLG